MIRCVKEVPSLEEFMGMPIEAEDEDEIGAKMERWMNMHNAKLGADQCHAVVAQVVEN